MKSQALLVLLAASSALAQGTFQNLDFEDSTIVSSRPTPYGYFTGTAYVSGWTAYGWSAVNDAGGTTLIYNNQPLDAAGASLEGVDYGTPAIDGQYSILLQGGSVASAQAGYGTNGAAILQTGQIPATAKSITYWNRGGTYLIITFNGQALPFRVIYTAGNQTVYGVDISAYSGQTGELRFTAPWPYGGGLIDNIEFSPVAIPEPSVLTLSALGTVFLTWRLRHRTRLP